MHEPVIGGMPEMLNNTKGVYEGELGYYFHILNRFASNKYAPYHNIRHMMHVTWLCYCAIMYYVRSLTKLEGRHLLIAAMFHDFNHSMKKVDDDVNITSALAGLHDHILPEDKPYFGEITAIIKSTRYPYTVESKDLTLCGEIIRDADSSQVFSFAWYQQVVVGLAREWGETELQVLRKQEPFLRNLLFNTAWANELHPLEAFEAKIKEANALTVILERDYSLITA